MYMHLLSKDEIIDMTINEYLLVWFVCLNCVALKAAANCLQNMYSGNKKKNNIY